MALTSALVRFSTNRRRTASTWPGAAASIARLPLGVIETKAPLRCSGTTRTARAQNAREVLLQYQAPVSITGFVPPVALPLSSPGEALGVARQCAL